jgi:hypothetical protein
MKNFLNIILFINFNKFTIIYFLNNLFNIINNYIKNVF